MTRARGLPMAVLGAVIIAAVLWMFGVPLGTILLIGIVLLCPLLMIGHHGGHGPRASWRRNEQGRAGDGRGHE